MTEEQIINAIANACDDESLHFQVIIQDDILHVYINRPREAELNYQDLKSKIYDLVTKPLPWEFRGISLYCRILGEIEPDWQAGLEIDRHVDSAQIAGMIEEITGAVSATHLIVDKIERELEIGGSFAADPLWDFNELPTTASDNESEVDPEFIESLDNLILELDLNRYCFVSNQRLLYAVLNIPKENIARLVDTFARFEMSTKRSQLPILEIYFNQSINPDLNSVEPETQSWWRKIIALDSEQKHQLAIWLSRYCLDPEQTVSTVAKAFVPRTSKQPKRLWETSSMKHKLSQQTYQENLDFAAKPGFFSIWLMLLRKFFQRFKSTK